MRYAAVSGVILLAAAGLIANYVRVFSPAHRQRIRLQYRSETLGPARTPLRFHT